MVDHSDVSRRALLNAALGGLLLAGLPSLAACGSTSKANIAGLTPIAARTGIPARQQVALTSAAELPAVVAGIRRFGTELHRASATVADNWTASPLSIAIAFGMLRAGSRGTTASQIDHLFGFPVGSGPQGSPHEALNALAAHLTTARPIGTAAASAPPGKVGADPIVAMANGLFVASRFEPEVNKQFLQLLAAQYGASPAAVSFGDPSAVKKINAWVAQQTRDRITKLFDSLDPATLLVLANTVYLKADWLFQFDPAATRDGPFTTSAGNRVTAPMMTQNVPEPLPYTAGDGWQRVSLPYVGDQLSMRIVVPTGTASSVAALGPAIAAACEPALRSDRTAWVDLTLPRWDTGTALVLDIALEALGLTDVFDSRADLSGIAPGLWVTQAVHRANISVDELGTEAAAVTGLAIGTSGSAAPPVVLRADRPFAWAVVHEPTHTPIFTGHVSDPTKAGH